MMTETKMVDQLIALAKSADASNTVRAITRAQLEKLANGNSKLSSRSSNALLAQHSNYLAAKINAFLDLPVELTVQETLKAPDGSPIGSESMSCDFDY